jgi:hypothetical protein
MGFLDIIKGGVKAASGTGVTSTVIGALSKVADKIWVDKTVRDSNMASISIALTEAKRDGDLAEYENERDRNKDIRESGWLSRFVRPYIAISLHTMVMWSYLFDEEFETKMKVVILEIYGIKITIGAVYLLVILFYFMTKGLKDWLQSKNPIAK